MSGLVAARDLHARGYQVAVVDKGRHAGGRMATRAVDTADGTRAIFDHGAQFITVRTERFGSAVADWAMNGSVREWSRGFADSSGAVRQDGHPRYMVCGGMNALGRELADPLISVRLATQVTSISWDDTWHLALSTGDTLTASSLILTPPVEQSLALLDAGGTTIPSVARAQLEHVAYDPCFAVLVELGGASHVPSPGAVQLRGEPLAWIADNHSKGLSPEPGTVTLHAGPDFTRRHWDAPHERVATELISAAAPWLGAPVRRWHVHRWRYSRPRLSHVEPCLRVDRPGPVVFAGDAFGSMPHVEGAFLSGLAAAEALAR
jgi:predicted NAD/FAD-dependent oxidoreductase